MAGFAVGPVGQAAGADELPERTAIAIEALSRMKGMDLEANPAIKTAVLKVLADVRGRPQFVELVRDFQIKDQNPALLEMAIRNPGDATGVDALRLVLENDGAAAIQSTLNGTNADAALKLTEALGNTGENRVVPLLEPTLANSARDVATRKAAVRSLAKIQEGAASLLRSAREEKLPADLKLTASDELNRVRWPELKAEAAKLLPLPQSQSAQPLPPVAELIKQKGDAANGAAVFASSKVGCSGCHQVNGKGTDFGPNLSEIGTKLGKDALCEAILDPSAGIAFGFEGWQLELKNGDQAFGLIISETADEVALKAVGGIVTRYQKSDIVKREQSKLSIMPAGLQQTMSTQEFVDLLEFLSSLKKR